MSRETEKFWASCMKSATALSGSLPRRPVGVPSIAMPVKPTETHLPGEILLWIPRNFLRVDGKSLLLRGSPAVMARMNRRAPGLAQTIDLLAEVSPGGTAPQNEIRLLALAALHNLISKGAERSAVSHLIAVDIIASLGLDAHPSGWSRQTVLTLPGQNRERERSAIVEDAHALGARVGRAIAHTLGAVAAIRARPRADPVTGMEVSGFDLVRGGLISPAPATGSLSWRMMTPGVMRGLVWDLSMTEIAARFGVSDRAVRAFCKAHRDVIDVPSPGFWRMSPSAREAVRTVIARR